MTDDRLDPYACLAVPRDATPTMIVAAYRALARQNHPDIVGSPGAQHRMAELNAAYSILRDPALRAAWDSAHPINVHPPQAVGKTNGTPGRDGGGGPCVWTRGPNGVGAAGPPPGRPSGSVLTFGRHLCWSIGEIARVDPGYLRWLMDRPEGRPYRDEIEAVLAPMWRPIDGRTPERARQPSPQQRFPFRRR